MNSISIIIPSYNEQDSIRKTIDHTLNVFSSKPVEIIVSDQSRHELVRETLSDLIEKKKVKYIKSTGTSRSETMNQGAKLATGQLLVFLHADTLLPYESPEELSSIDLHKTPYGGFHKLFSPNNILVTINSLYRNWVVAFTWKFLWDNTVFLSRTLYNTVGGFPNMKLFEDVKMAFLLKKQIRSSNQSFLFIPYPVITSSRRFIENGPLRVYLFMAWMRILYSIGVNDKKLQTEYRNFWRNILKDQVVIIIATFILLLPIIVIILLFILVNY